MIYVYLKGNCSINKISTIGNNINMAWSPNGNYIALGNKVNVTPCCPVDCALTHAYFFIV